jgi:Domain of unknown function (DUF4157)
MGADFADVRVHAGPNAAQAARSLDARAFTHGAHIVFGAGQYAPDRAAGRLLLAHELIHVSQLQPGTSGSAPTPALEHEANAGAQAIVQGRRPGIVLAHDGRRELRQGNDDSPPPSSGQTTPPRRVVMVDGSVFDQINRGNQPMADAMVRLRASNARIVVGAQIAREWGANNPDAGQRGANQAMLHDLGVEIDPPDLRTSTLAGRVSVRMRAANLSKEDASVVAEADAAGVELWSADRRAFGPAGRAALNNQVPTLRIAPETEIAPISGKWSYVAGRKALGLPMIVVNRDGTYRLAYPAPRRAPGSGGGTPPDDGGEPPAGGRPPRGSGPPTDGGAPGGGVPASGARAVTRRAGQLVSIGASAAQRILPFVMALHSLRSGLQIADGLQETILKLESAGNALHDVGLGQLPIAADIRKAHLSSFDAREDEEIEWLAKNGIGVLRAVKAGDIRVDRRSDFGRLGAALFTIQVRADQLNDLNVELLAYLDSLGEMALEARAREAGLARFVGQVWDLMKKSQNVPALEMELLSIHETAFGVLHDLTSIDSALMVTLSDYFKERWRARHDWLYAAQVFNLLRPLEQEILRGLGVDTSSSRQAFPLDERVELFGPDWPTAYMQLTMIRS